jgi:hypothetical protein
VLVLASSIELRNTFNSRNCRCRRNPNPFDDTARAGEKIFTREGCAGCHKPPLYTNNKITLADGFKAPPDRPAGLDLLLVSVKTDPNLALKTRKGTGYQGVW